MGLTQQKWTDRVIGQADSREAGGWRGRHCFSAGPVLCQFLRAVLVPLAPWPAPSTSLNAGHVVRLEVRQVLVESVNERMGHTEKASVSGVSSHGPSPLSGYS